MLVVGCREWTCQDDANDIGVTCEVVSDGDVQVGCTSYTQNHIYVQ